MIGKVETEEVIQTSQNDKTKREHPQDQPATTEPIAQILYP